MYKSSLNPAQFVLIKRFLPVVKSTKPKKYSDYVLLNALLYVLVNGIKWRELPYCFPPWKSVYWFHTKLIGQHSLDRMLIKLNEIDRKQDHNIVSIQHILVTDTKSIRTTSMTRKKYVGYDGHKKIKGLKLSILCDTRGNVWSCKTAPANTAEKLIIKNQVIWYTTMKMKNKVFTVLIADKGYQSKKLDEQLKKQQIRLYAMKSTKWIKDETIKANKEQKDLLTWFNKQISKLRYVVERTFSWLENCRRLIVCYERKTRRYEEFVKLAMVSLLVRRLRK
jgi:putative transposase